MLIALALLKAAFGVIIGGIGLLNFYFARNVIGRRDWLDFILLFVYMSVAVILIVGA